MAKQKNYFITGTDTDAGKTLVTCALLNAAKQQGLKTLALKPVAAGSEQGLEGLVNRDAVLLSQEMTEALPYAQVNPVLFDAPVSPHIAAAKEGRRVSASQLAGYCRGALMKPADLRLIEGAGGWRVPINMRETMADLAVELQIPVILVVGMKLGCLNHALLTAGAIARDGLPLVGWVANQVDADMSCFEENIQSLAEMLKAPCLGIIPRLDKPTDFATAAKYLNLSLLSD
ncbi:dethiobiotin synthase [Spongiibacter sp. IMCC21906]|jgi:dethiobiotin synthetase|uniref:dethiobiotin synthase n=1 Tax=Spongiibacter sp. IMCC21906 TaxID=1620392 RepID=UPI00062DD19B|nr:dethiobiotin synthase [Spongiibacter sp. IMCC21906]AKH70463.1 dethiobiotin synthase [Spongiibacter sp. IMCC21906]